MSTPLITPPSWLNGVQPVRHVTGGIWEIDLTGYGRTLVGPYAELHAYISPQGLGEDAHHIVGREHLGDIATGFTDQTAPAVAMESRLHNELISSRITTTQRDALAGRAQRLPARAKEWVKSGGRTIVTRRDVAALYREVYEFFTSFRELAIIANNILGVRPPTGSPNRPPRGLPTPAARGTGTPDSETSRSTSPESRGTRSPDVPTSRSTHVPDVRTKAGRFAENVGKLKKLRIGFGADLIIQIATQLMLGILEAKLSRVNREGIQRAYKEKIYKPLLKKIIDETVTQVRSGIFAPAAESVSSGLSRQWIYVNYRYDVLMERQAADAADAIISIVRGFDFVEVYHSLEPVGKPAAHGEPKPLPTVIHRLRRERAGDLFRYPCVHNLLVWDPHAAVVFDELRKERLDLLVLIARTMQGMVHSSEASRWAPIYSSELEALVAEYQFHAAHTVLIEGALGKRRYPKIPAEHRDAFTPLIDALSKADRLLRGPSAWAEDRQTALKLYLDADPFGLRAQLIGEQEEWRRRTQREAESRARRARVESAASSDIIDPETRRVLQRRMQ